MLSRVRTKLSELVAGMDAFVSRAGHLIPGVLLWPLLYAVTIGSGVFVIRHLSWVPILETNKTPKLDSIRMVIWVGVTAALLGLVYAAAIVIARLVARRRGGVLPSSVEVMATLSARLRPLLALPLVPALTLPDIERDSPKATFFIIAVSAVAVGAGAYAWMRPTRLVAEPPEPRPGRARLARVAAAFAVAGLWAFYGGFFSRLSLINHHALNTRTIDLGFYDNIFYQTIHGRPLACTFVKAGTHASAHFDPILVLFSPLYLLYPHAELLLIVQAVWLGSGVVPLYLLAQHKLGSRPAAVALAAMYVIYPALHGANMYEFHSLTLLPPIILWLLYFLETCRFRAYWLMMVPALLCREDVSLLLCFVGAYAILSRRPRWSRLGWVTILVSLLYLAVVKRFFMLSADIFNSGKDAYSYAYYYEELIPNQNGAGGLLLSLTTNPWFVLKTLLSELKILYVVTLFLPLAFTPFLARPGRVLLVYGLLFCLLASRGPVYSVHFQYSCTILAVAFAITPAALRQLEDGPIVAAAGLDGARLWRAVLVAAFGASLLVSWKFGAIVDNQTFRGGFARVSRGLSDKERETYAWVREQAGKIPIPDSVGITNKTGPHASNRREVYFYPEHNKVEWVFIDESELKPPELEKHHTLVKAGYELVSQRDRMVLYRKKKP